MARGKKHTAEQIVNLLRQVEVGVANGKTLPQACKEAEIVEQKIGQSARSPPTTGQRICADLYEAN